MRGLALYGCILSLLICCACGEATISPGTGQATKNGPIYYSLIDMSNRTNDVYRINSDGTGKKLIYSNADIMSAPALGQLGIIRKISDTEKDIALLDLDGKVLNTIPLVDAIDVHSPPILSPTANKILYLVSRFPNLQKTTEIRCVNTDGTNDIILEANAAAEHIPVFSPDGTKIAYMINGKIDAQNRTRDTLVIVNTDGTERRKLTDEAISINDGFESLDWSPDGTKIACLTESVDRGYDIIVVDIDDAETHRITTDQLPKLMPVFSPDSKKIAFCSGEKVGSIVSVGISIIDVDGANRRNITISSDASTTYPRWSPDGKSIIVTQLNVGSPDPVAGTLKLVDVESGNTTVLGQSVYKAYWSKK
jgi:dipeptidyl aminopeptidase/acylaminoacyl peptidase